MYEAHARDLPCVLLAGDEGLIRGLHVLQPPARLSVKTLCAVQEPSP